MALVADLEPLRRLRAWPSSRLHDRKLESDIVEALIEARRAKGLSMNGVARRMNLSSATLWYWEQGISFPDRLAKLIEWGRVVGKRITIKVEP